MFAVYCPTCRATRLITHRRIEAMHNTDTGIHVFFTCDCGTVGLWISGRRARTPGVFWPADATSGGVPSAVAA